LHHYRVSPAVLVYHGAHWNVVCGVQTDVDPAGGAYVVEGFWLNNPVWDASLSAHDDGDTCGSGGAHGIANEFVTYADWQTNRFNGCAYDDSSGATQWVSVCDPTPAKIELPQAREPARHHDGRSLIHADRIEHLALGALKEYGLFDHQRTRSLLSAGQIGKPRLVHRLDRPGDFYYLAPWEVDGRLAGMLDIDARFGNFKSLRIHAEPVPDWLVGPGIARTRQSISRLIDNQVFDLPDEKGRFRVFPGTYCVPPLLVWRPCRESWSPHLPFYQLAVGGHLLYVRVDGAVFTSLTSGRGA
jgi:hypothetical protein